MMNHQRNFERLRREAGIVALPWYFQNARRGEPLPEQSATSSSSTVASVVGAGATMVSTVAQDAAKDPEIRGRMARWILNKTLGV